MRSKAVAKFDDLSSNMTSIKTPRCDSRGIGKEHDPILSTGREPGQVATQTTVYTSPKHVRWAFDTHLVMVVDEQRQRHYQLDGWHAAVWNWLTLSYAFARIRRLLSLFLGLTPGEAEEKLRTLLQEWQEAGLLQVENEENPGNGVDRG